MPLVPTNSVPYAQLNIVMQIPADNPRLEGREHILKGELVLSAVVLGWCRVLAGKDSTEQGISGGRTQFPFFCFGEKYVETQG